MVIPSKRILTGLSGEPRPKRACRRNVNYAELDENEDGGTVYEMRTEDFFRRSLGQPVSYTVYLSGEEEKLSAEDMKRKFGTELVAYLEGKEGRKVYTDTIYRLWLMPDQEEDDSVDMKIDYVCLPPENITSSSELYGCSPGIYHGGEIINGKVNWYPIKLHTLSMLNIISILENNITDELKSLAFAFKVLPGGSGQAAYQLQLKNPMLIIDILDKFCMQRKGSMIRVSGPGSRSPSIGVGPFRPCSTTQMIGGMSNMCLHAAFINGIWLVTDQQYAKRALRYGSAPVTYTLKKLSRYAQKCSPQVSLCKTETIFRLKSSAIVAASIEHTQTGVCIVQLKGSNDVNHIVCIAFDRVWIVDSSEHIPLNLSLAALHYCRGNGSQFLGFGEIRRLVLQGNWKKP